MILPTLSFPTRVYFVCFFALFRGQAARISIKARRGDMDNIQQQICDVTEPYMGLSLTLFLGKQGKALWMLWIHGLKPLL